jgi:hypothetical protein
MDVQALTGDIWRPRNPPLNPLSQCDPRHRDKISRPLVNLSSASCHIIDA